MKIKHALHHMIFKAYHLKLEISYFTDQRTFLSDINSLRELNDMSAGEMVTSIDSYASPNYNSVGRKASLACPPLSYAVDIHISDGDGSTMKSINGGQCNSSELAEGSLILHGSNRHQHVSNNSDRILEECHPLTSESISSPFGSKENEDDNDGSANLSPLVETFDYKKQLTNIVHENRDSELHIDRKDGHFSDLTEVTEIQIDENANEVKLQNKGDVWSLLDSESILVLISSQCITKQVACVESHLSRINYYGDFDVSLGRYLQDILLSQKYTCSSCDEPSEAHIYRYTHRNGILAAIVSQLPRKSVLPGEAEGKIWMWTRCLKCNHNKGFPKASRRVVMSFVACGFSFGKFLDLSFANHSAANRLSRCGHFLHKDCLRFFGLGSKVAMFRYSPLGIYTACKPQLSLEFYYQNGQVWMMKEAKDVLAKGELIFGEVANALRKLKSYLASYIKKQSVNFSCSMKQISEIESMLERDKAAFEASLLPAVQQGKNVNKIPDLNWLIKELHFMIYLWDRRLHFLLQCVGKFSSDVLGVDSLRSIIGVVSVNNFTGGNVRGQGEITEEPLMLVPIIVRKALLADGNSHTGDHEISEKKLKVEQVQFSEEITPSSSNSYISVGGNFLGDTSPELSQDVPSIQGNLHFKDFEKESVPILDHVQDDDSHHVSSEPLSNAEEAKESERRSWESCKSNENPIMFRSPHNSHSDSPEQWIWASFSELRKEYMKDLHDGSLHKFQFINIYSPLHLSRVDKLIPRECSLHFLVGSSGSVVSLVENDISSIIACALASYKDQHGPVDSIDDKKEIEKLDRAINISNCLSTESLESEGAHTLSPDELSVSFFVDQLIALDNSHPKITLGPCRTAGKSKHSVICIYAKEFRSLRKNCILSELAYISSLSRCNKWDAQGGKSKVFFAKTMDERFIIKQMKKTELDSFLKFGPQYFNYLSSSLASGSQTCLAKILGIYQVRNGKEVKTDLMVMENLLFGRNISCKYDLKGATFSRYVSDGNGPNVVLLDENFIEDMRISPIYVGGRSKRLLERAIWNDTSFLTSINVMDYSLLVGVDKERRELVFGIIDYVRQYTWDKQLETWVKFSLVVPKNALPTVVSPKEYKKRFRKFLSKYILMVPDAWSYG
ncbi:1-phosphatidylinositol-3-phosphate 5-kinase FAB1A [Platanthera guangdongensis]|uniref:1-phosphatidylinositol-3-phosphate 5-kinase FAB1A n=1 Tax=Platanthera guangdongensis TaxID=2320717 RepID=A0ABR2MR23_9ASPA